MSSKCIFPMRKRFNLDATTSDEIKHVLIFGPYGAGKTHLQGDFLKYYREKVGKPVHFLNLAGEDGYQSLTALGLGEVGESVDTLADYEAALIDYRKEGTCALAVDSLTVLYRLLLKDIVGDLRYPDPARDGEKAKAMWGRISMGILNYVLKSRSAADYTLWVAPFDKNTDPVLGGDKPMITPNLPGQNSVACYGWFDMVGYLNAVAVGPGQYRRTLSFENDGSIQTRQRLPQAIKGSLQVPEGGGGWAKLRSAIETTFKQGGGK